MLVENQQAAATALEELEPALKEIVSKLRSGVSDGLAYALVYRLRREIGYVVADLGSGSPRAKYDHKAEDIIEAQRLMTGRGRGAKS